MLTGRGGLGLSLLLFGAAAAAWGQKSAATGLVIQVNPEAHLSPSTANLTFRVTQAGEIVVSQPITVSAWVRSVPGQQIQLIARVKSLTGPAGDVPVSALRWSGSMAKATGGGVAASCTSGTFADGLANSLISGWIRSGIVTCDLTFSLATDADGPTGLYNAEVDLTLPVQ
jgi:hypothetical protein